MKIIYMATIAGAFAGYGIADLIVTHKLKKYISIDALFMLSMSLIIEVITVIVKG